LDLREIRARFIAEYVKTYGYADKTPIELMKVRVAGRGLRTNRLDFAALRIAHRPGATKSGTRLISFTRGDKPIAVEIIARDRLSQRPIRGPLIIEEFDATIVVPPDATVHRDTIGCVVVEIAS
jgi:N-methylhydantoinase A